MKKFGRGNGGNGPPSRDEGSQKVENTGETYNDARRKAVETLSMIFGKQGDLGEEVQRLSEENSNLKGQIAEVKKEVYETRDKIYGDMEKQKGVIVGEVSAIVSEAYVNAQKGKKPIPSQ